MHYINLVKYLTSSYVYLIGKPINLQIIYENNRNLTYNNSMEES